MKLYRHNGRGSLVLALSLPGVVEGKRRFRIATGSHDAREVERIRAWLLDLYERAMSEPRTMAFLNGVLAKSDDKLVAQWRRYTSGRAALGLGKHRGGQPELRPLLRLWLDSVRLSPSTQRDRHYWLNPERGKLLVGYPPLPLVQAHAPVSDLLVPLAAMRQHHISGGLGATKSEFRKARAAVMAFYRDLPDMGNAEIDEGLAAELWKEAAKTRLPRTTQESKARAGKKLDKKYCSPAEARALVKRLPYPHSAALWALFVTGMNPREYFGEPLRNAEYFPDDAIPDNATRGRWEVVRGEHHVRVHGTKQNARDRKLPIVWAGMPRAQTTYFGFAKALRWAQRDLPTEKRNQPYDLRRGFAVACVHAGITRSRRMGYMGHTQGSNVQDLYEEEAARPLTLMRDGVALRKFFGKPPIETGRQKTDK